MKTKISLHVSNAKPVVGEEVIVEGIIKYYDEKKKTWIPFRAKLEMFIDGEFYDKKFSKENGVFEFRFSSDKIGERDVEVLYRGNKFDPCSKKIIVEFITFEEKKRIERIAKIALLIIISLIISLYLLMVLINMMWR